VIDLEEEDNDTASRSDDLQMSMPTNQGFAWEGCSMLYPNAFFSQWPTPVAFNQSIALSQASSMTPKYVSTIPTMNPASSDCHSELIRIHSVPKGHASRQLALQRQYADGFLPVRRAQE
jgi:hypothetical protein